MIEIEELEANQKPPLSSIPNINMWNTQHGRVKKLDQTKTHHQKDATHTQMCHTTVSEGLTICPIETYKPHIEIEIIEPEAETKPPQSKLCQNHSMIQFEELGQTRRHHNQICPTSTYETHTMGEALQPHKLPHHNVWRLGSCREARHTTSNHPKNPTTTPSGMKLWSWRQTKTQHQTIQQHKSTQPTPHGCNCNEAPMSLVCYMFIFWEEQVSQTWFVRMCQDHVNVKWRMFSFWVHHVAQIFLLIDHFGVSVSAFGLIMWVWSIMFIIWVDQIAQAMKPHMSREKQREVSKLMLSMQSEAVIFRSSVASGYTTPMKQPPCCMRILARPIPKGQPPKQHKCQSEVAQHQKCI